MPASTASSNTRPSRMTTWTSLHALIMSQAGAKVSQPKPRTYSMRRITGQYADLIAKDDSGIRWQHRWRMSFAPGRRGPLVPRHRLRGGQGAQSALQPRQRGRQGREIDPRDRLCEGVGADVGGGAARAARPHSQTELGQPKGWLGCGLPIRPPGRRIRLVPAHAARRQCNSLGGPSDVGSRSPSTRRLQRPCPYAIGPATRGRLRRLLTLYQIAGPSYKVIIPSVIHVAGLRLKQSLVRCPKCKAEVTEDSAFCSECGTGLQS